MECIMKVLGHKELSWHFLSFFSESLFFILLSNFFFPFKYYIFGFCFLRFFLIFYKNNYNFLKKLEIIFFIFNFI